MFLAPPGPFRAPEGPFRAPLAPEGPPCWGVSAAACLSQEWRGWGYSLINTLNNSKQMFNKNHKIPKVALRMLVRERDGSSYYHEGLSRHNGRERARRRESA